MPLPHEISAYHFSGSNSDDKMGLEHRNQGSGRCVAIAHFKERVYIYLYQAGIVRF